MLFLPMEVSLQEIAEDEAWWKLDVERDTMERLAELQEWYIRGVEDVRRDQHQRLYNIDVEVTRQRRELGKN